MEIPRVRQSPPGIARFHRQDFCREKFCHQVAICGLGCVRRDPKNRGIVGKTIPVSVKARDTGTFKPKGDGLKACADDWPIFLACPAVATILAAVSSMPPASWADGMEVDPTPNEISMANWQRVCREIRAGRQCKSILDSACGHQVRSKQHLEEEKASKERQAKEAKAIEEAAQAEANPAAGQGDGTGDLPAGKHHKRQNKIKKKASNLSSP